MCLANVFPNLPVVEFSRKTKPEGNHAGAPGQRSAETRANMRAAAMRKSVVCRIDGLVEVKQPREVESEPIEPTGHHVEVVDSLLRSYAKPSEPTPEQRASVEDTLMHRANENAELIAWCFKCLEELGCPAVSVASVRGALETVGVR